MRFQKGKTPILFKMAVGLFLSGLLGSMLLLLWRDFFAPTSQRPGYECISRGKGSELFVPCWFTTTVDAGMLVAAVAFVLMPVIYGAYSHLHAPQNQKEGKP